MLHPIFVHSILDDAGLSAGQFRVYGHISRRADKDGVSTAGIPSMAEMCQLSQNTVRACLKVLVSRQMLKMHEVPGKASGYSLTAAATWLTPTKQREGSEPKKPGRRRLNPYQTKGGVNGSTPTKQREGTPTKQLPQTPTKQRETKVLLEDTPLKEESSTPATASPEVRENNAALAVEKREPAASAKPATKAKPNRTKPEKTADPRFKPVTDGYCAANHEAIGSPYVHAGGRDGKKLKQLLATANAVDFPTARIVKIAKVAMQRNALPYAKAAKFASSLSSFCDHFNAIRAELITDRESAPPPAKAASELRIGVF